jgi:membrane protease YdiL (CAAX protease family)
MTWIERHPIGAYLLWFAVVGQAFAFMPLIFPAAPSQLFILGSTLLGMLLPALVITRIADGHEGYQRLWERILKVRVPLAWYAFALLVLPVPAIVMALLFFGGPDAGTSVPAAVLYGYVVQGVIVLVTNNLWEEVAVMGFLQARLQDRHGPMRAVVLAALFFTFQHIALIIGGGAAAVLLPFFFVTAFGFRALIGWTYNRTDSLFIVGLLHAASNAATGGSGFFGSGVIGRLYESEPFATVLHLVAALVVGLALIAATRGRLGSERPSATEPLASQST